MRCIDADELEPDTDYDDGDYWAVSIAQIENAPTVEPERKKDIIQKFHDYQIDWLKSHYDIELEPQLEEMIVRFLHDTANCYMMETGGEQECKRQSSTATE